MEPTTTNDSAPEARQPMNLPGSPEPEPDWKPCYVRFGELPEHGFSYDHRRRRWEAGVSYFRGYRTPEGYLVDLEGSTALGIAYLGVRKRRAFALEGKLVGTGCNGEPLLKVYRHEALSSLARIGTMVKLSRKFRAIWRKGHEEEMQRRAGERGSWR